MSKGKIVKEILSGVAGLASNKKVQKTLFGTYADGTIRSFADAWDGEFLSPSQREEKVAKAEKKKKKKKSKKKKNKIDWY